MSALPQTLVESARELPQITRSPQTTLSPHTTLWLQVGRLQDSRVAPDHRVAPDDPLPPREGFVPDRGGRRDPAGQPPRSVDLRRSESRRELDGAAGVQRARTLREVVEAGQGNRAEFQNGLDGIWRERPLEAVLMRLDHQRHDPGRDGRRHARAAQAQVVEVAVLAGNPCAGPFPSQERVWRGVRHETMTRRDDVRLGEPVVPRRSPGAVARKSATTAFALTTASLETLSTSGSAASASRSRMLTSALRALISRCSSLTLDAPFCSLSDTRSRFPSAVRMITRSVAALSPWTACANARSSFFLPPPAATGCETLASVRMTPPRRAIPRAPRDICDGAAFNFVPLSDQSSGRLQQEQARVQRIHTRPEMPRGNPTNPAR